MKDIFQPVDRDSQQVTYKIPEEEIWPPKKVQRKLSGPGSIVLKDGTILDSICMKCQPARCLEYLPEESEPKLTKVPNDKPTQVCPTNSIKINPINGIPMVDMKSCIHCQLCLVRCPVGAIYWKDGIIEVSNVPNKNFKEIQSNLKQAKEKSKEWISKVDNLTVSWEVSCEELFIEITSFYIFIRERATTREYFYILIRNLFRLLGFEAFLSRSGDTQWRLDAICLEPFVMPIEIKSPGESLVISPDATRQAVENAALIEARFQLAVNPISIVVGYNLPNERSDVGESLENIHTSLGVTVGLYTAAILLYLCIRNLEYRFHPKVDLYHFFRSTLGPCDGEKIKDYWAEYIKNRLESIVISSKNRKLPSEYFPVGLKSIEEFLERWKKEFELISRLEEVIFPIK